ncbi:MAG: hypothetical protein EYC62_09050 [Alphaproteobacteria bacterium]|nr:MAG: hypothetical protein EYC62_09050 [Alphaproteobacteria bacterium]
MTEEDISERITREVETKMATKKAMYGDALWQEVEKSQLLRVLDMSWKDHLLSLDHLRHGVRLSAYAQRDPLMEYKREAFNLFHEMLGRMRETVTMILAKAEINPVVVEAFQQAMSATQQPMAQTLNFSAAQQPQKMQFSGPAKEESRGQGAFGGGNSGADNAGGNRAQRRALKKK